MSREFSYTLSGSPMFDPDDPIKARLTPAKHALVQRNDAEMLHQLYLALGPDFWRLEELSQLLARPNALKLLEANGQ